MIQCPSCKHTSCVVPDSEFCLGQQVKQLTKERDVAVKARADTSEYAIDLQRLIEAACFGRALPKSTKAPYHTAMLGKFLASARAAANERADALRSALVACAAAVGASVEGASDSFLIHVPEEVRATTDRLTREAAHMRRTIGLLGAGTNADRERVREAIRICESINELHDDAPRDEARAAVARARREGAEAMREAAAAQVCRPMLRDMAQIVPPGAGLRGNK